MQPPATSPLTNPPASYEDFSGRAVLAGAGIALKHRGCKGCTADPVHRRLYDGITDAEQAAYAVLIISVQEAFLFISC